MILLETFRRFTMDKEAVSAVSFLRQLLYERFSIFKKERRLVLRVLFECRTKCISSAFDYTNATLRS